MNFNGAVSYDLLRKITPREFDFIMMGLREYRAEEQRAHQKAMADSGHKVTQGGGTIYNG